MNFINFLKSIAKDPEAWEKKQVEDSKINQVRFNIGGKSGFKWKTESANKTWIENGKVVRERKGKTISK